VSVQRGRDGPASSRGARDDEIESDSEVEDAAGAEEEEEEDEEEETADEKRLRLARAYLGRLKAEEGSDEGSDDDEEEDGIESRLLKDTVRHHTSPTTTLTDPQGRDPRCTMAVPT
jgi:ribosomal RNA-processing protein 9